MHACVRACVRACARACVRARARVYVHKYFLALMGGDCPYLPPPMDPPGGPPVQCLRDVSIINENQHSVR